MGGAQRFMAESAACSPLLAVSCDKWLYAERLDSIVVLTCN